MCIYLNGDFHNGLCSPLDECLSLMGKSQRITHFACPQHVKMGSTTDNSEPEGLVPLFLRCLEPERCLNLNLESKPMNAYECCVDPVIIPVSMY